MMVDPINDIARQAQQGSVSAIIQILNEKLADSGIRTRAMFDQGVLQLLCEAATPEQLEQPTLVAQVRQILESLHPRNVRRVNINSRIVREQQLLWLEEIKRDPQQQLLWSEEITLAKPGFMQQLGRERRETKPDLKKYFCSFAPDPARKAGILARFSRGASLSLFLLLLGWALYTWLGPKLASQTSARSDNPITDSQTGSVSSTAGDASPAANSANPGTDPFAEAVRLAEDTVGAGQTAETAAEWLDIASRWQRASDLMGQIPAADPRYPTAQDRVQVYQQNSDAALQQANRLQ